MSKAANISERVLILTPTGHDAANARAVLEQAGLSGVICEDCPDLQQKITEGAGALLIAEEALTPDTVDCLLQALATQPPWSDLPLLLITSAAETEEEGQTLLNTFAPHGKITLIERPVRPISLVSALRSALRGRRRQYQMRAILEEQQRILANIQGNERRFRAVFNQQFQFMAILSPEGIVLEVNELPLRATGVPREQVEGKVFWETPFWTHLPEMRENWPKRLAQAARSSEPVLSVDTFMTAEGAIRIADAAVTAVRNSAGEVEMFIIQATDITERQQAEENLRASEERYRSLFQSIDEGFCIIEVLFDETEAPVDYRFLVTNPAFELHTGLRDALGKTIREMIPDQDSHWFEIYGRVAKTGEAVRFEDHSKPMQRWFNVYAFRVGRPEERKVAVLISNITSRKQAEQATQRSEERYRSLVAVVTDVPWTTDAEGAFVTPQTAWANYTGQAWDEYRGFGWANALHPDDRAEVQRVWTKSLRTRSNYHVQARMFHAQSGEYRHVVGRAVPLVNSDGTVREWVGSCTDVHEQRLAAQKLERTVAERTAQLRDTVQQLETFSYSIVHDMRAPLRSMRSFASFLQSDYGEKLDETGQSYLARIISSASRLDALITDVLSYSRVSMNEADLQRVDLGSLLKDLLEQYPQFQEAAAHIHVQPPLPVVLGNHALLTQVFSNLLGNALKFVRPGRKPSVTVRAESSNGSPRVRVWVEDNGIGIPTEYRQKLFGLFQRLHKPEEYAGTGVGLAIVKKAIERMGGAVGVESEPNQGSRFWIELAQV